MTIQGDDEVEAGAQLAELVRERAPWIEKMRFVSSGTEATTAAIDNLKLLAAGRAGMAFCYDYHVVWANDGKVPGLTGKPSVLSRQKFAELRAPGWVCDATRLERDTGCACAASCAPRSCPAAARRRRTSGVPRPPGSCR